MPRSLIPALMILALALCSGTASAFKPALLYDQVGKSDRSFNEAAFRGAERFKKESGLSYQEFTPTNESQYAQAMQRFAARGYDPIIVVGFSYASVLEQIAPRFPDTRFVIVDMAVDQPNVQSVVFREHEGSFLVGMIAAMKTKTGKIGFVGGMDIPLIRKFALGYKEGAQYVNKDIRIFENMTGNTPAAWGDPIKAGELARSQFDRGADVIYQAAGSSGLGVLQAAADLHRFSIGTDANQNYMHPGSVLTSMVKRVDLAVFEALRDAGNGTWKPGTRLLGLAEGGVDYSLDQYNESLITPEMRARVDRAKADIIAGRIKVTNYFEIMDQ
ncbi:Membrane lipoprotein TmpC precursor [Pseudodesulfovibrio hydrargyri]|uniref:Membrane lipoprotein TmpC n=1 Tax=Pseudodesulfovibrio hydrargyri TaxID=2125990 RepID=A0A1J5MVL3_9BACT|nr:BMP family ABC transporter substrate-binding protein [Pseudodesulfovibrio hydrargyri]OIQ50002.1 Membrane lipoprotein TmpC precursor [Pseudodesulfovibrio hydrargyri]